MKIRHAMIIVATLLLAACASQPKPLQGDFAQISPRDSSSTDRTGALVRWGGRIVHASNYPDHSEIDDPALFQTNREVTFTGRIDGYENRRIGGYDYRFPRVAADVVYLWPIQERVDVITRPAPWPWWGYW